VLLLLMLCSCLHSRQSCRIPQASQASLQQQQQQQQQVVPL
jgi:hypothetical protein